MKEDREGKREMYWSKQWGYTESKDLEANRGVCRLSTRHLPKITDAEKMDAAEDDVNKQDRYLSLVGPDKYTAGKGEYNHFIISPFFK